MAKASKRKTMMQAGKDAPVVQNRKKRPMGTRKARSRRIGGKLEYMPKEEPPSHATGLRGMMPPMPTGSAANTPPVPPADMPPLPAMLIEGKEEHYIRMRVRVQGDQMQVVGAWLVRGPVVQPEKLYANLVYEVAIGSKQISVGSIPDAGVRRSFPPPEPVGDMKGHHIEVMPSYEFPIRVPRQDLSVQNLASLRISLYSFKGAVPERRRAGASLVEQFTEALHPVAELKGIQLEDLPETVQADLKKALER